MTFKKTLKTCSARGPCWLATVGQFWRGGVLTGRPPQLLLTPARDGAAREGARAHRCGAHPPPRRPRLIAPLPPSRPSINRYQTARERKRATATTAVILVHPLVSPARHAVPCRHCVRCDPRCPLDATVLLRAVVK